MKREKIWVLSQKPPVDTSSIKQTSNLTTANSYFPYSMQKVPGLISAALLN